MDADESARLAAIDPSVLGSRVRAARRERGLTQGELGGDDASIAYVSRIEAGERRPSGPLLVKLAATLGLSVEALLADTTPGRGEELRLAVSYAELALESGEAAEALARSAELLTGQAPTGELGRRVRFVHARALEVEGRVDEAIVELEDLIADEVGEPAWIVAAIALSRCYQQVGDSKLAISRGEEVLARLEDVGLRGCDEEIQLMVTVAFAYHEAGDTGRGLRVCQRAIERAERMGSAVARASAYWNASVIAAERGDTQTALPMAERALALFGEGRDARNLARLRSMTGILHLRTDPPGVEQAQELLTRASGELSGSSASMVDLARNDVALGRSHYLLGDDVRAEELAAEAVEVSLTAAPRVAAQGLALLGQIAFDRGDQVLARERYQRAVGLLTAVGSDRIAAELWLELADQFRELGDPDAAMDAYHRAAASTGLRTRVRRAVARHE